MTGFAFAEDKLEPFGDTAEVLGIVVDLTKNKPSRVEELSNCLDDLERDKSVVPSKMPSILGKLQYADSHVWGRAGKLALAQLRELGHTSHVPVKFDENILKAFNVLKLRLCSGKPKVFEADHPTRPHLIFTDGALEYKDGKPYSTIGAVFISPDGTVEVFGCEVPALLMDKWQAGGKTHVIGLVELYACIVSYLHWKPRIESRRLLMFVDNWPAIDVLVKGTSLQPAWRELLLLLEDPFEDYFYLWVARVPSSSNVADHPSRGDIERLKFLNPFQVIQPRCPVTNLELQLIV